MRRWGRAARARSARLALPTILFAFACGKKGPPLPPLVKVPTAPIDFSAVRRGDQVDLQLKVPDTNTDRTRPANIERVDIYAITGASSMSDDELLRSATRIAAVAVKAPRDPDETIDPGEPAEEMEPPEGEGLDQGAIARAEEAIGTIRSPEADPDPKNGESRLPAEVGVPLLGPAATRPVERTYFSVGVSKSGRRGPISPRIVVPLVPPPLPPPPPTIAYDERTLTLTWASERAPLETSASNDEAVLPSRPFDVPLPPLAYHVWDVSEPYDDGSGAAVETPALLTRTPLSEPRYEDSRPFVWDVTRCYVVRSVETVFGSEIQSESSLPGCVTPADTFAPGPPKELRSVAGEGSISLIWQANSERDLEGYIVLRAASPGEQLEPVTPQPIQETNFTDAVRPGIRFAYAVRAVDRAGNASEPSNRVEETAR
jgi:hypothetical protein